MKLLLLLISTTALVAQTPQSGSASVRPSGSSLGRIRLGAADPIWFTWRIGAAFPQLTLVNAAVKADALGLGSVEGFSTQTVSFEIPKKLAPGLFPGELTAIKNRLTELNVRMSAYHSDAITADRKLFEFAKALGIETIIAPTAGPDVDALAEEFKVNIALENPTALDGRSKRIGLLI